MGTFVPPITALFLQPPQLIPPGSCTQPCLWSLVSGPAQSPPLAPQVSLSFHPRHLAVFVNPPTLPISFKSSLYQTLLQWQSCEGVTGLVLDPPIDRGGNIFDCSLGLCVD